MNTVRARLNHPVIDADGHMIEFLAPIEDYVKAIGGTAYEVRFTTWGAGHGPKAARARRETRTPWLSSWFVPTKNTLDRATAALPKLLHERMDEIGLDFTVLFPSLTLGSGLGVQVVRKRSAEAVGGEFRPGADYFDAELRRVTRRAYNAYRADICREFADRMTPVATLSMITPEEAIQDMEYAVGELGMKAVMITAVRRPIPAIHRKHPDLFPQVYWMDFLGQASEHDYDPFWARSLELKVPVLYHNGAYGTPTHNSPDNSTYNRLGAFATGSAAACKSIFLGGATRRFPSLKIAFLECGVSWACQLYRDLIAHWEKRNPKALTNLDPAYLDKQLFVDLHARYGGPIIGAKLDQVLKVGPSNDPEPVSDYSLIDDFRECKIERAEDIRDLFVPRLFFGCEADDPFTSLAFKRKLLPFGVALNTVLSSDIGHWDVTEMRRVLEEAYGPVRRGLMSEEDFRELAFTNPAKLFAGTNPNFFKGTAVEGEINSLLASGGATLS